MSYWFYKNGKKYGRNLDELRWKILKELMLYGEGNMEISIPIFDEKNRIAEIDYLKELPDHRVYYCFQDCRRLRTYRTYYDLADPELTKNKGLFVIEIPKMIGKQLIAKDVYANGA